MKILLAVLLAATFASAKDAQPDEKLCSIKTVYVTGDMRPAKWFIKNIPKKTWLKVEPVRDSADAILELDQHGAGPFTGLNVRLVRRDPEELLWIGESGGKGFLIAPYPLVLGRLKSAGRCK